MNDRTSAIETIFVGSLMIRTSECLLEPDPRVEAAWSWLRENYTLDVIVSVQSKPQGLQENEERAFVLAAAVENVVADYPTLSDAVTGLMFMECSGMSVSSNEAGIDGPHSVITVHFQVKARLS